MPNTAKDIIGQERAIEGIGVVDKQLHAAMIALFQGEPAKILKNPRPGVSGLETCRKLQLAYDPIDPLYQHGHVVVSYRELAAIAERVRGPIW